MFELEVFRKSTVLVTLLGLFGVPRSDCAMGNCAPLASPRYAPGVDHIRLCCTLPVGWNFINMKCFRTFAKYSAILGGERPLSCLY